MEVLSYAGMGLYSEFAGMIEKNLSGRIEITGLADVAQLSPFYFQRLFSRLVGKPSWST
jgi:AraC-like DNA-binding protein